MKTFWGNSVQDNMSIDEAIRIGENTETNVFIDGDEHGIGFEAICHRCGKTIIVSEMLFYCKECINHFESNIGT